MEQSAFQIGEVVQPYDLTSSGRPFPLLNLSNHSKKSMNLQKTGASENFYRRYTFKC